MRLFVAITPPRQALDDLAQVVEELRSDLASDEVYRWAAATTWHITLAFLGEVDDGRVPGLESRLTRAAARHAPMSLALDHGGAFSSPKQARVLWTGVTGDVERLRELAWSVTAGVRRAGIDVDEKRRFRPHVTLARLREQTDVRPAVAALREFHGEPWRADTVHLVRSRLGRGEQRTALHETVASFPLGSAAPPVGGER